MSAGLLFMGGPFRIATFIPDVTVEAVGQDALGITGFPVETGVTMADHSFKLPVRLEMVAGWSDSSAQTDGYIQQIYGQLQRLQASRQPFTIFTSRRMYKNMLMESLTDPINAQFFTAMLPRITFRELIISRTQESTGSGSSASTAQVGSTAPGAIQSPVNQGSVQPEIVNFSGQSGTAYGGYDSSLGLGPATGAGSVGALTVEGVGTFDDSLGERTATTDPSQLGGDLGLFGRYSPGAFANAQPFRI
jgi:hypothetical protein